MYKYINCVYKFDWLYAFHIYTVFKQSFRQYISNDAICSFFGAVIADNVLMTNLKLTFEYFVFLVLVWRKFKANQFRNLMKTTFYCKHIRYTPNLANTTYPTPYPIFSWSTCSQSHRPLLVYREYINYLWTASIKYYKYIRQFLFACL